MSVEYKDTSGVIFQNRNFNGVIWYQPRFFTKNADDTSSLSDNTARAASIIVADISSLSDSVIKTIYKFVDDVSNLSDAYIKPFNKNISDNSYLLDAISKDQIRALFDISTLSDQPYKLFSTSIADISSLSDSMTKPFSFFISDISNLTDGITHRESTRTITDICISQDKVTLYFEGSNPIVYHKDRLTVPVKSKEVISLPKTKENSYKGGS